MKAGDRVQLVRGVSRQVKGMRGTVSHRVGLFRWLVILDQPMHLGAGTIVCKEKCLKAI